MGPVDRTTEIVQDVLSFFAENSKHTLADSRHAPKNARQMLRAKRPSVCASLSPSRTHNGFWVLLRTTTSRITFIGTQRLKAASFNRGFRKSCVSALRRGLTQRPACMTFTPTPTPLLHLPSEGVLFPQVNKTT